MPRQPVEALVTLRIDTVLPSKSAGVGVGVGSAVAVGVADDGMTMLQTARHGAVLATAVSRVSPKEKAVDRKANSHTLLPPLVKVTV